MTSHLLQLSLNFPKECAIYQLNDKNARSALPNPLVPPLQPCLDQIIPAGPSHRYYWSKGLAHERLLGSGYTASVYKGVDSKLGDAVAIKYIPKANQRLLASDDYFRNIYKRIRLCNHRNLLKIRDFYESEDSFYVVSDLCTGPDLVDFILQFKPRTLSADCIRHIMFQILSALNYLHSKRIVHRDIKLDNILFTDQTYKEIRIVDFDMAMLLNHYEQPRKPRTPEEIFVVGTKDYMAPENYYGKYSEASDLWSVGVMMYIFFDGHFPFDLNESNMGRHNREALKKGIHVLPELRVRHPLATDLLYKLLEFDIRGRICTARDALCHPWFKEQLGPAEKINNFLKLSLLANKTMTQQQKKLMDVRKQQKPATLDQTNTILLQQQRNSPRIPLKQEKNPVDLVKQHQILQQRRLNQIKLASNNCHPLISSTPLPTTPGSLTAMHMNNLRTTQKQPDCKTASKEDGNQATELQRVSNSPCFHPSEENKANGFKWQPNNNVYKTPTADCSTPNYTSFNSSFSNNSTIASSREFRDKIKRYLSTKNHLTKPRWFYNS